MSRYGSSFGDRPTHLEQPRDPVVAQIVKVKVLDLEELACMGKATADRIRVVREHPTRPFCLEVHYAQGLGCHLTIYVVALFLARMLHITNKLPHRRFVEIFPRDPVDFILSAGREDRERHDPVHRQAACITDTGFREMCHQAVDFQQGRAAIS